jgi:hypothetical protein
VKYSDVKNSPFILKFPIFMLPGFIHLILEALGNWKVHLSSLIIISSKKVTLFQYSCHNV